MAILAVCGLKREAEIAGGFSNGRGSERKTASQFSSNRSSGVIAVAGGGDGDGLKARLEALHGDIAGVISIGLGGALSPLLKVGEVVIAEKVITGVESWDCHAGWRNRLCSRLPQAHQGTIFGSDVIVDRADTKLALHDATGALVVDMESQVAARFAAARQLPLAALRVISDDAHHVLPPAALVAMKPDGDISLGRVLWSLVKKPQQLPALIRTGRASSRAFRELLRCRNLCGVGLAGLDL
jgi:hopanoid-associated phosphorylase